MVPINKELQKELLLKLSERFPHAFKYDDYKSVYDKYEEDCPDGELESLHFAIVNLLTNPLIFNIYYLERHGLIELIDADRYDIMRHGAHYNLPPLCITEKGIDFLLSDGGLTSFFNNKFISFDIENIKEIIDSEFIQNNVPQEKQSVLRNTLKQAPTTLLNAAISAVVEQSFKNPGGAAKAFANVLGITW